MKNKENILAMIAHNLESGTISREEVLQVVDDTDVVPAAGPVLDQSNYYWMQYVGAIIVLFGVGVYVAQFWNDLGTIGRVFVSLGGAWAAYAAGTWLMRHDLDSHAGIAFHVIGWVMMPFGLFVFLDEVVGMVADSVMSLTICSVMLVLYGVSMRFQRHYLHVFFAMTAAVALVYTGLFHMVPNVDYEVVSFLTLIIGAITIVSGYKFKNGEFGILSDPLYSLGVLASLGAVGSLFSSYTFGVPAELLFPVMCTGVFYLMHDYLYSRRGFTITVIGVMIYIVYMTSRYFADTVGWPIALIIIGISLIAVGYRAIQYTKERRD